MLQEGIRRQKRFVLSHKEVLKAQALQIAKCVGELCVVLKGDCDAIILTGGVAHSKMLMDMVIEYVGFLAPVYVYPGENEMEALALGGIRMLSGEEPVKDWTGTVQGEQ